MRVRNKLSKFVVAIFHMRKFVLEHSPCVGNSRINFELVLNSCPRISLEIAIISSRFCYKRISSTFMGMRGIKIAFTGFTNKNFNEDECLIVSPFGFFRIWRAVRISALSNSQLKRFTGTTSKSLCRWTNYDTTGKAKVLPLALQLPLVSCPQLFRRGSAWQAWANPVVQMSLYLHLLITKYKLFSYL